MMKRTVYVTEPNVIDIPRVRKKIQGTIHAGDTAFTAGQRRPYDTLVIRSNTKVGDDIKKIFPHITSIVRVGTGLDNIDLEACKRDGISVFNAAGANADAVSEYITMMILFASRRLDKITPEDINTWNRTKFIGCSMSDHKIGLIGFGNIGRLLHAKMQALGTSKFYVYDPYIDMESLPASISVLGSIDELIKKSTVVSLHIPLTDETVDLFGVKRLRMLNKDALLINASRGGIVDETAVIKAIDGGAKFTYIADTVKDEPRVNPALLTTPNVIVTPHIASLTTASSMAMLDVALDNLVNNRFVN